MSFLGIAFEMSAIDMGMDAGLGDATAGIKEINKFLAEQAKTIKKMVSDKPFEKMGTAIVKNAKLLKTKSDYAITAMDKNTTLMAQKMRGRFEDIDLAWSDMTSQMSDKWMDMTRGIRKPWKQTKEVVSNTYDAWMGKIEATRRRNDAWIGEMKAGLKMLLGERM